MREFLDFLNGKNLSNDIHFYSIGSVMVIGLARSQFSNLAARRG
jgi:hypothetical protein